VKTMSKKINKIWFDRIEDTDPDLSYIQDLDRMEAYNRGDWGMIGIRACAEIHTSSDGKYWKISVIRSAGLWGIESDSREDHFAETAKEELSQLTNELIEFGFKPSQFPNGPFEWKE
jgi:hypothetical protein